MKSKIKSSINATIKCLKAFQGKAKQDTQLQV